MLTKNSEIPSYVGYKLIDILQVKYGQKSTGGHVLIFSTVNGLLYILHFFPND